MDMEIAIKNPRLSYTSPITLLHVVQFQSYYRNMKMYVKCIYKWV